MSPSTSKVNAGPIELIPTLVAGVPCTFTIVAPKPTLSKLVVVIPATYAFPAVAKPRVVIPVTSNAVSYTHLTLPTNREV